MPSWSDPVTLVTMLDPTRHRARWIVAARDWIAQPPAPGGLHDGAVVLAVVRTLVLAFLFPYVAWLDSPHKTWVFVILGAASAGHVAFCHLVFNRRRAVTPIVAQLTVLVDAVAIGLGVLATGGGASAATIIWAPNLAVGAVWLGVRAMVPALGLVVAEMTALGVGGWGADRVQFSLGQSAVLVSFMLTMLVVVGGVVSQRQRRTMRALDSAEARAERDPLTGLLNRSAIEERIGREIARSVRLGAPMSVLLIDLDDFKVLNDTRGHLVGDLALMGVANVLLSDKRPTDAAARLGGEEFVVLLPEADEEEAVTIANRLRRAIMASAAAGVPVTASIGIACHPTHVRSAIELLGAADAALYAAKGEGKNRVVVYRPEMPIATGGPGNAGDTAVLVRHATRIAFDLGMSANDVHAVRLAAMNANALHDHGDIAITRILERARLLTDAELRPDLADLAGAHEGEYSI